MRYDPEGHLIFSPTDLIRYLASPFASWMERCYLETPRTVTPDEDTEDARIIAQAGDDHERTVLDELKKATPDLVVVPMGNFADAFKATRVAMGAKAPIIYQAAFKVAKFAGFADFLMLDEYGRYQVWDTKLAQSPKPYYAIQLCCYTEMLSAVTGDSMAEKFGIILGGKDRVEFRVEDFIHYYGRIKSNFLLMQECFTGNIKDRPEPLPQADHGRWTSHAETFFHETDHLVQVSGITVGQIKKLKKAEITTMTALAAASGKSVRKLASDSLEKLVGQARLQCLTLTDRLTTPEAPPQYEVLPHTGPNGEIMGLATLPSGHPADVFFDMEGYPLVPGGLEYLFGLCFRNASAGSLEFKDWWAHDRDEERIAFEGFIDWVYKRWRDHPGSHIYHYAAYEVSAVRRLSTRHDTRQDEVDELLRNEVFVDLYQIVRHGLRIGEGSYSIKVVERLYRPKRETEVATGADSIVQYVHWMASGQPREWTTSLILKNIRDYNEDDCKSTAELLEWLWNVANHHKIPGAGSMSETDVSTSPVLRPAVVARLETASSLRNQDDMISGVLADLIDFHRREEKPAWWRMFDRADATPEELRDDSGCIEGIQAIGEPEHVKQSLVQTYCFDPDQECKLTPSDRSGVMFTHNLGAGFNLMGFDTSKGELKLKIGRKGLMQKMGGNFPVQGSLLPNEHVPAVPIQLALAEVANDHLATELPAPVSALLNRMPPSASLQSPGETTTDTAIRITGSMSGECLVIQGPPGSGKTYTASHAIASLLSSGKKVGVASNSHKAVVNLLIACGEAVRESGYRLDGIKVGGEDEGPLYSSNPDLHHIKDNAGAYTAYQSGVIGGTAWLFTRPEWEGALDFLFIDEAGQVSMANTVAMARCADNLVLLGDQMQLEQPIQGSHPGDAGLSALQYALKDNANSRPDAPVFHAVVPHDYGIFLKESRRMHPLICRFISESIYEGRLGSHPDCDRQRIAVRPDARLIPKEAGIVFCGIEHEGNVQQSDEEVVQVKAIYTELLGCPYTVKDGSTRSLVLEDFLFIAPYNAQVRALEAVLPAGARVGSVDRFQGQEAPICILSMCCSYGEYGSRGLAFILDRNRINVAISRAQCLVFVVADPRIANADAASIEEMKLINLFCKLADS